MRRVFALLQATWLALLIAEPATLHACEMHAAGHSAHAVAPASAASDDEHAHHENHAEVDAADASTSDAATAHCQCLGECCAASAAVLSAPSDMPAVARIAALAAPTYRTAFGGARAPDLQLPHANGPPSTLTT